jgi:O-antigen ligase
MARARVPAPRLSRPVAPAPAAATAVRRAPRASVPPVGPLLRWSFLAFVFSIPFEAADIGQPITVSKIFGYLFLLVAASEPRTCFRRSPRAMRWFVAYLVVYVLLGIPQASDYVDEVAVRLFTLVQMLILLWIAYNLLRRERMVNEMLRAFCLACFVLAVLQLSGVTATTQDWRDVERVTALRQNPNELAGVLALGLVALTGLVARRKRAGTQRSALILAAFAVVAVATVQTGSRGGVLALGVGLLVFLRGSGSRWSRARNLILVIAAMGIVLWISTRSETALVRWQATLQTGNLAGREAIYPEAWRMFLERPLIGWGPVNHVYELGARVADSAVDGKTDTHNLLLWLLTETGVLGLVPFAFAIGLSVRGALRARRGPEGVLPLALLATMLALCMSGTWQFRKLFWLVLAYALAAGSGPLVRKAARLAVQPARIPAARGRRLMPATQASREGERAARLPHR